MSPLLMSHHGPDSLSLSDVRPHTGDLTGDMSPNDTHYVITTQQSANIATAMVQGSGRYCN